MNTITVRVDDAAVLQLLAQLSARLRDLSPVMRNIGGQLRESSMRSFDDQRSPDGKAWRPLSAAAIISRARRNSSAGFAKRRAKTLQKFTTGAKALVDSGDLRDSVQIQSVTPHSVNVGTGKHYAAIHNFGGKAGRGRKVTIPARQFIGLDAQAKASIVDTLRQYILAE